MSGWVVLTSPCAICKRPFNCNPKRVPSLRPREGGEKVGICSTCIEKVNQHREANGDDPVRVHADAYEPMPEEQLT